MCVPCNVTHGLEGVRTGITEEDTVDGSRVVEVRVVATSTWSALSSEISVDCFLSPTISCCCCCFLPSSFFPCPCCRSIS